VAQTVNLGNNNTGGSTDTVNIGSVIGSSVTNISGGSGGVNVTGPTNVNVSANNATNINTGTSTGTVTIGNANDAIALNGATTLASAADHGTLGAEGVQSQAFNNATYWTLNGWSGTATNATNNTSNTGTLSATASGLTVTNGSMYQVTYTLSGSPAAGSTLAVTLGGTTVANYTFAGDPSADNVTDTRLVTAGSGSPSLGFTPSGTYTGTVSVVSVKLLTPYSTAALTVNNASSVTAFQVRASNDLWSTYVGRFAGLSNVSGTQDTALGSYALEELTTGGYNTAVGTGALQFVTSGSNNTATGADALQSDTTGAHNTAFGASALLDNTTGYSNIGIGYQTLQNNTTGYDNVGSGTGALITNTTGYKNTAVGQQALESNTTGYENTALGIFALDSNTIGNQNVAIGYSAGYTTVGANANVSGAYNTFIGNDAGPGTSTQLYRATAIGTYAVVSQNDSIVLGCVSGVNGCTTTTSVGIDNASPSYALDVSGTIRGSTSVITPLLQAPAATALTITGNATSNWTTSAGDLTVDATASGATLNLGTGSLAKTINLGDGPGVGSGTSQTLNLGWLGNGNITTYLGNASGTSYTAINGGTSGIDIGRNSVSNTITIGNRSAASANQTIYIGDNSASSDYVTVGSGYADSNVTINSGSGGVGVLSGTGNNSTSALFVENAAGNNLFNVDTADQNISLGTSTAFDGNGISVNEATTNIITNPSFESGLSGWTPYWSGALTQVTGGIMGSSAMQIVTVGGNGLSDGTNYWLPAGLATGTYTVSVYMKSASQTPTVRIAFEGNQTDTNGASTCTLTSSWQRCTYTTTVTSWGGPSSGTKIDVIENTDYASAQTWVIDGAQMETGSAATTYTDTSRSAGSTLLRASTNSTSALQVQNASGVNVISVDTTLNEVTVSGSTPTLAGSVATGTAPQSVYVQGRYAYVVNGTSDTLQVFDVSTPASPVSVGSVATGTTNPDGIYVQGRYAYVVNYNSGASTGLLQIYDISNPSSPAYVGVTSTFTISSGNAFSAIAVSGRYAYVSTGTIYVVDVSNPASPVIVGSTSTFPGQLKSIAAQGRYAYGSNGAGVLSVFDMSNPASPVCVGVAGTNGTGGTCSGGGGTSSGTIYSVSVQGRYAYVVNNGNNTLYVIDISNPSSPVSVGSAATGTGPRSISVQGTYAYVTNSGSSTLQVFDVSNPASPVSIGTAATGTAPYGVSVSGRYAYLVNNTSATLQAFDLGGAYVQQLQTGGLETGTLQTAGNATVNGDLATTGGLTVGSSLDVNGTVGITGATTLASTTDAAALGSELTNSTGCPSACVTNFTSGWTTTGWTATTSTATHTAGNTSVLTYSPATTNGSIYQVTYTLSGSPTAGSTLAVGLAGTSVVTYTFTGDSGQDNITDTQIVTASSGSTLTFTPSSNYNGVVSAVSVELLSQNLTAALTVNNASGSANIQVRGSNNTSNLFIGLYSGESNVSGTWNTALGKSSLQNLTTGISNTAIGFGGLSSDTSGGSNTAVGAAALQNNTSGGGNTALGVHALISNTTGYTNSAVGGFALNNLTTGYDNNALGYDALDTTTSGYQNVAIGNLALDGDTTGYRNTAVGYYALQALTTGNRDIALGGWAGVTNTPANATTTGTYDTYIGQNAGQGSSTQLDYSTAIGADTVVSQSNSITIGCVNGINSCPADTSVGIDNATPTHALDVNGIVNANAGLDTSGTARIDSSGNISNAGTITSAGNVNINTTGSAFTTNIGTGAAAETVAIGSANTTSTTTIHAGTGGLALGNDGVAETIQIGDSGADAVTQTINIGNIGAGGTANIVVGSTVAGTTTLQSAGGVAFGTASIAANLSTPNTTAHLFTSTATTIQIGGANSGSVYIGPSAGTTAANAILLFPPRVTTSGLGADPTESDGAMYFNSGNQSFRCASGGNWSDCSLINIQHAYSVQDEFMHCGTASGSIGDLGWNELLFGSADTVTCDSLGGVADHPGTSDFVTSSTSGRGAAYRLNSTGAAPSMTMEQDLDFKTGVLTDTVTNTHTYFGFAAALTNNADGLDPSGSAAWWETDPNRTGMTNNNWHYCYYAGSSSSIVCADTGVAASTTNWTSLEIRFTAGGASPTAIKFYLNGTAYSVSGLASNDLTGAVGPVFAHVNTATGSSTLDVDYVQISGVTSASR
jgi:hypothetical protein